MRLLLLLALFCLPLSGNYINVDQAVERAAIQTQNQCDVPNCSLSDISPTVMIENMVCPITGSLSLSDFDAQAIALEPITIDRSYNSDISHPNVFKLGWIGGYRGELIVKRFSSMHNKKKAENYSALYTGPYNQRIFFVTSTSGLANVNDFSFNPEHFKMGLTNIGGKEISGRSNLKNTELKPGKSRHELLLKTGGGMEVSFEHHYNLGDMTGKWRARQHTMANGNSVSFTYGNNGRLSEVKTYSCTGKHMASASYQYTPNKINISLMNGSSVIYDYDIRENLIGAYRSDASYNQYQYDSNRRLTKKIMADGRYIQFQYDGAGRVVRIFAPSNADGSSCPTHGIAYHEDKVNNTMTTVVKDPWNNDTVYISRNGKISEIEKKIQDKIYSTETLTWAAPGTRDQGCLLERSLRQADNNLIFIKNYHYDERGNPHLERLWGNITGKTGNIWNTPGKIMMDLSQEHHQLVKTFTQKNLLASENDGQKLIEYFYHKNTDLISYRFTKVEGQIVERHFFEYDEDNALVKEIEDDGTSNNINDINFTYRKIHNRIYSNSVTGLHDIEEERVFNLETMEEELVRKKEYKYDHRGRVIQELVFDSQGEFAYDQKWEYDAYGSVIKEINPLGGEIHKTYDQNQNLISDSGPLFDHTKVYFYDAMNRLVRKEERHGNELLSMSFQYDPYGRKLKEIDTYGNETDFRYDAFGRLIETLYPSVCNEVGEQVRLSVSKTYDEQGFVKSVTDQAGNTTQFWNTIKGKPYAAYYPDGTKEHWEYDLYGNLVKHISTIGLVTTYTNDWKGRPLVENVYSKELKLISSKSIVYSGNHPIKITDVDGSEILSTYNAKGQITSVEKAGVRTEFTYDSLGRVSEKTMGGLSKTRFAYNILDQITDEWNVDDKGTTTLEKHTEYDFVGRPVLQNFGGVVTSLEYNSKGEVVRTSGAEDRVQVSSVDHHFVNEFGQTVKKTVTVDPSGSQSEIEFNTLGQERKVVRKDAQGNVLQKGLKVYTPTGKLQKSIQSVIYKGEVEKDFVVYFDYDQLGRPTSVVEAKDEPIQKITRYTYNNAGQKDSFIKPDGTTIGYLYDEQGRVQEEKSSDGTVHYEYNYDILSRPVAIKDHANGLTSEKTYNKMGHVVREKLGSGHVVEYDYDNLGRMTLVHHEGTDKIDLEYDSDFLRKVRWKGQTVSYDEFDAGGRLVSGDGIKYRYDAAGRNLGWQKDKYSESCKYTSTDNLIQRELLGIKIDYEFDSLNQLQEEKGAQNVSYRTDSLYNRREKNGSACTLNSLNQLLSYQECKYEWDRNGNMIAKTENGVTDRFVYDAKDRLIEVVGKVKYVWDDQNRRIFNNDKVGLYQGLNEVGTKVDGKIREFRVLGLGKGAEIGASVFVQLKGEVYKPLHDISGNMIALLSKKGDLVESYEFTAFGDEVKGSKLGNPWGFSSKRKDAETGFILFGHRFYHPPSGRFVTADPLGYSAGVNLYAYCNNSPLTHNDLYGLEPRPIGPQSESDTPDSASRSSEPAKTTVEKVVSVVKSVFENLFKGVKKTFEITGKGIGIVSHHTIPQIPGIKDIFMGLAHFLQHWTLSNYVPTYRGPKSGWVDRLGKVKENSMRTDGCGILSDINDAKERAEQDFILSGGFECAVFYPQTHGLVSDLISCLLNIIGVRTHAYKVLKGGYDKIAQKVGPNGTVNAAVHSRCCILAKLLAKDWKAEKNGFEQRIKLIAVASPVIIGVNAFRSVNIIMSSRDIVCFFAGIGRLFPPNHVEIIPGTGIPGLDHAFMSQTHQKRFQILREINSR